MKKILLSAAVASLLITGLGAEETKNSNLSSKQVSDGATKAATKKAKDSKTKLVEEALASLELTAKALKNLDDKKNR